MCVYLMENKTDLICPSGEKYIMFLPTRYFKSKFFGNIYKKLRKNLENLGIKLFSVDQYISSFKQLKFDLVFDDKDIPVTNQLYVHLFKNFYYSDSNYNKKRIEKEREHLFLLAGKLGVSEIHYTSEITETEITSTNLSVDFNKASSTISHQKSQSKKQGMSGSEAYENRGASVYVNDKDDINKIEENLQKFILITSIFSYDFYKQCPKLEAFVLKRCSFRMKKVEYCIESEDISDLSLAVKTFFNDCGLGISYDKNILHTEKIKYDLVFYNDEELEEECVKRTYEYERSNSDPFYSIRKCFENWNDENDKKSILYEIYDYIFNVGKNCYGHLIDETDSNVHHFYNFEELFRFLLKTYPDKDDWENFTHTEEIKDWIEDFFYAGFFEVISEIGEQTNGQNLKLIGFLKNSYAFVPYQKIQHNIKWISIDWSDSDDKIEQTIKTDLNNNCKKIQIDKTKLSFSIKLGDKITNKGKKSDSYVIKRTYSPVSRMAKSSDENEEKIVELTNENYLLKSQVDNLYLEVANITSQLESRKLTFQNEKEIFTNTNDFLMQQNNQFKMKIEKESELIEELDDKYETLEIENASLERCIQNLTRELEEKTNDYENTISKLELEIKELKKLTENKIDETFDDEETLKPQKQKKKTTKKSNNHDSN